MNKTRKEAVMYREIMKLGMLKVHHRRRVRQMIIDNYSCYNETNKKIKYEKETKKGLMIKIKKQIRNKKKPKDHE